MNRVTTVTLLGVLGLGLSAFGTAAPSRAAQDATPAATTLVEAVRQATVPYQDATAAEAAGYAPMLGCVSGPQSGAMGEHYMNGALIGDGVLDASQPEALLYAPQADGTVQLAGVEYLVLADAWDASHDGPPILDGQLFNYVGAPNRYRNPAFYELHVWAGQDNPNGMFADFNPTVSCDTVAAQG
jgi:hypothetical protein